MKRWAFHPLIRRYKRVLFVLAAALLGSAVGAGLLVQPLGPREPSDLWQKEPRPPVRLTRLITDPALEVIDGVYAATADGTLYVLLCQKYHAGCAWSRQDAVPARTRESPQDCGEAPGWPDRAAITPRAPGPVVDTYAVHQCRMGTYDDDYYILLEDGSLWYWVDRGGVTPPGLLWAWLAFWGAGGSILGLLIVFVAGKVVIRRVRSIP